MNLESFINDNLKPIGMPLVGGYFDSRDSAFLNTRSLDADPLQAAGEFFLTPYRYLTYGSRVVTEYNLEKKTAKTEWEFEYNDHVAVTALKVTLCVLLLLPTLVIGAALRGLSMISPAARLRYQCVLNSQKFSEEDKETLAANRERYTNCGIDVSPSPDHYRSPKTKDHLLTDSPLSKRLEKINKNDQHVIEEIGELIDVLNEHNILYWADFGTCLGIYRHNGMIPGDKDVDFSILSNDHDQVLRLLKTKLPKDKYRVMDFSPPSNRDTIIKVELRNIGLLVDLYHYTVDEENETVTYNFSHINSPLIPAEALKRELPYTEKHIPFNQVFPLRPAQIDGLNVFVPNQIERYLKGQYGEDLSPCKKFDPEVGDYVKDPDHPYWQQSEFNY